MPANPRPLCPVPEPGTYYLWTLPVDPESDSTAACGFEDILSSDEMKEALRFRHATSRQQFVWGRVLLRLVLSRCFPFLAADWRFERDCNRRPYIAAPAVSPPVKFSVSHTRGLVACLISLSAEAAVDVEDVEDGEDLDVVAKEVMTPAEQGTLSALSGTERTNRFYELWTLKEAYAKARGLGLSLPLRDIGFDLEPDNAIRAHFASGMDDDPSAWVFWRRHLHPRHTISVAAKRVSSEPIEIVLRPVRFDGTGISPVA